MNGFLCASGVVSRLRCWFSLCSVPFFFFSFPPVHLLKKFFSVPVSIPFCLVPSCNLWTCWTVSIKYEVLTSFVKPGSWVEEMVFLCERDALVKWSGEWPPSLTQDFTRSQSALLPLQTELHFRVSRCCFSLSYRRHLKLLPKSLHKSTPWFISIHLL